MPLRFSLRLHRGSLSRGHYVRTSKPFVFPKAYSSPCTGVERTSAYWPPKMSLAFLAVLPSGWSDRGNTNSASMPNRKGLRKISM
jgi:hypothetical protein